MVDFDWETTGQEDMNQLYEQIHRRRRIQEMVSSAASIENLLAMCHEVLEQYSNEYSSKLVAHVIKEEIIAWVQLLKKEMEGVA